MIVMVPTARLAGMDAIENVIINMAAASILSLVSRMGSER